MSGAEVTPREDEVVVWPVEVSDVRMSDSKVTLASLHQRADFNRQKSGKKPQSSLKQSQRHNKAANNQHNRKDYLLGDHLKPIQNESGFDER
jgi:hypothetical protein